MPKLATLKKHLEANITRADATLAKFKADLDSNPVRALQWVDTVMIQTAARGVHMHFLAVINSWQELVDNGGLQATKRPQTEEALLAQIQEAATRQVLTKTSFTNQSTSIGHNAMERFETAAYADLIANWDMIW